MARKRKDLVVVDAVDMFRRATIERRLARGILDGASEDELCEVLGLPKKEERGILADLTARVQAESVEIARMQAIRQTGQLSALYLDAEKQWCDGHDPRYAELMRGALRDIRDIWGVDAAKRIALGGSIDVRGGVLGGVLHKLDDAALDLLARAFEAGDEGAGSDGEGLPSSERLCKALCAVPVGGGEAH